MNYQSTRNNEILVTSSEAILQGLSKEGGLFVPTELPKLSESFFKDIIEKEYIERAVSVLSLFLTDFPQDTLNECVTKAYSGGKFENGEVTPIAHLLDGRYLLELWHGPTCAFKDMALQLLPHLLKASSAIQKNQKEIVILTATSGDTGKAALEGFMDVSQTKIIVFYPLDGVSPMQKRQMTTQKGDNVHICAINGNFDDAQTAVKSIFTDDRLKETLENAGFCFSSANSINWGRLVPQIVYYISAYADLVANEEIKFGDKVNICVPTGNFGNILAAYYAKKMGVPFGKLICASNENNVLTDFIKTGVYDKNREFYTTTSPSMDILVSSNLERLLYDLSGSDDKAVSGWLADLNSTGRYEVSDKVKAGLLEHFACGCCNSEQVANTIKNEFDEYSYLLDTHTAVAVAVYNEYKKKSGDDKKVIIASTASPYKFTSSVLCALKKPDSTDEFEQISELSALSGTDVPQPLLELSKATVRFKGVIEKKDIANEVLKVLKL